MRETTLLARQSATIDLLSHGRLTLGVGIGVRENDYWATGFDFHRRGVLLDEQLSTLRRLWAGERFSEKVGLIGPSAFRSRGPESSSSAVTCRRWFSASPAWGDGYMAPGGGEPESMIEMWRRIGEAWAGAGRVGQPRWVGASYFALGPQAVDHASRYINANYGYNPELAARRLRTIPTTRDAVEIALM